MGDDIRKQLKKFLPLLLEAQSVNLNESDTVFRLVKVFEEVLGYDPMKEIKSEYEVNGKYVDLAVQVDDAIRFFVEAKGAGVDLKVAFITKTEIYAAEGNVPWVLLTNGVAWNLYHLSFKQKTGLKYDLVFAVDLGSDELDKATELLGLLHRQSIRSGAHQKYWDLVNALRPESLGKALFTEEVLRFIRRNVRKQGGPLIDINRLASEIYKMFSPNAQDGMGPLKISKMPRPAKPKEACTIPGDPAPAGVTSTTASQEAPPPSPSLPMTEGEKKD